MEQRSTMEPRLRHLCRRVRWRLGLRRALARGVTAGAVALGLAALAVALVRLRLAPVGWLAPALGGAAAVLALGVLSAWLRRPGDLQAAWRLDEAHGLRGRLTAAVAILAEPAPTPMMEAALRQAAPYLDGVTAARAVPWRRPRHLGWLLAAAAALGAALLASRPLPSGEARALAALVVPERKAPARASLLPEDRERLVEEAERLADVAAEATDPRVKAWIEELNELLRALHEGRITAEEAHARLARLEQAHEAWEKAVGEDAREVAKALEAGGRKVRRPHAALDALFEALRQQRWEEAARALQEAAAKERGGELADRDRRRMARDLEALAEALKTERQRQADKLRRDRDRLKQKEQKLKDRFASRDRDRLKEAERELERLSREAEQQGEMRRQLERLQREVERAAEDLARREREREAGGQAASAEDMERAAEMLRRLSEAARSRRQMRTGMGRLVDAKDMLRRGGPSRAGQGGEGEGEGQRARFARLARGGDQGGDRAGDQGGEPGGERGGGKDGKGKEQGAMLREGEGQGGKDLVMLGPPQGGRAPMPGAGTGPAKLSDAGDGAGEGHDPNVLGEATRGDVETVESRVAGAEGQGPSESRVVYTAATRGFATQSWREVHQDYREVVEERLERQEIPAGQRRYVRRYFDLIRPR